MSAYALVIIVLLTLFDQKFLYQPDAVWANKTQGDIFPEQMSFASISHPSRLLLKHPLTWPNTLFKIGTYSRMRYDP